jgi:acyl-CoA dehydrogenase
MATRATQAADGWALNGSKTWISNGDLADFYVRVRQDRSRGRRARHQRLHRRRDGTPGLDSSEHIHVMAPHPLATLRFERLRGRPPTPMLGPLHGGFKLAMQTLDIFRASVAAAALGMARRALAESDRACQAPQDVRPDAGRLPAHAGQARRDERAHRRRGRCSPTARPGMRDCSATQRRGHAGLHHVSAAAAMAKLAATENASA